jgi:outer membrane protein assembly factor BamB/serine/threonine protein kinase
MGRVYLGRSPGGRLVAVKVVRPDLAEDGEFRRRFAREVAAARRVNGAFTAGVVDADPEGSPAWLATVYVPGLSLGEAVDRHGPWPQEHVLVLGAGLAEGLEVIHAAGVVHRDLKPSNVLLAGDGPRVIDFGISVASDASALTRAGMLVGSPGFMSPEQLTGRPVGPACDVFALGAVLTFTATGVGPFGSGSAHGLNFRTVYEEPDLGALPNALRAVVAQCLAKDPDRRPGPARLLDQLTEAAGGMRATTLVLTEADWMPEAVARTVRLRTTTPSPASQPVPAPAPTSPPQRQTAPPTTDPAPSEQTTPEQDQPNRQPGSALPASVLLGGATGPGPGPREHPPGPAPQPSEAPVAAPAGTSRRRALLGLAGTITATGLSLAGWHFLSGDDIPARKPRWKFTADNFFNSRPVVSGGLVYAHNDDGYLYTLDAATGEQRWKFRTAKGEALTSESPAVSGGLVYVGGGNHLYALDAATGRQQWKFPTSAKVYSSPAVSGTLVYVTGEDAYLHAVDAATGKQRWKFATEADSHYQVSPAVSGGLVYIGTSDELYALDAATGEQRWKFRTNNRVESWPPVIADGAVYVASHASELYKLDAATGEGHWRFTVESGGSFESPAVSSGVVYVSHEDMHLYALDAASGKQRWKLANGNGEPYSAPAASDGVVYVSERDRYIMYAVDAATGKEQWKSSTDGSVDSPPVVSGGLVYVGSSDLYALPV